MLPFNSSAATKDLFNVLVVDELLVGEQGCGAAAGRELGGPGACIL